METAKLRTSRARWNLAPSVIGLAIAALVGGALTAPAWARDDHDRGHRGHDYHRGGGGYGYGAPAVVYAPPPVYYAPPPGPPALDFVFPIHIR